MIASVYNVSESNSDGNSVTDRLTSGECFRIDLSLKCAPQSLPTDGAVIITVCLSVCLSVFRLLSYWSFACLLINSLRSILTRGCYIQSVLNNQSAVVHLLAVLSQTDDRQTDHATEKRVTIGGISRPIEYRQFPRRFLYRTYRLTPESTSAGLENRGFLGNVFGFLGILRFLRWLLSF